MSDLKHNLRVYSWLKIFTKRVYLPLTTIYLVSVGRLSLAQIGALATISALTTLAATIPTGYFADRVKRKTSLVIGGLSLSLAAIIFAFFPQFPGAVAAVFLESLGFSFNSGAGEALMHDTLTALGQSDQYVRVMGRAQSIGLIGNSVLVGLVPLTYSLDKRLPFICGAAAAAMLAYLAANLVEPARAKAGHLQGDVVAGLVSSLRTFINRWSIVIFLAIGLLSAFYSIYANFVTLVIKDLGVNVSLLGFAYSASSVVGAAAGLVVHHFKRVPFLAYALFDVFMATSTMVIIGTSHNLAVALVAAVLNLGFWRMRSIMYQDKLLGRFGSGGSKATLVSTLGFFDNLNEVWLPYLFVLATTSLGYYLGFTVLGLGGFVVLGGLMVLGLLTLDRPTLKTA